MLNTDRLCLACMKDNGGEKVCPICGYDSSIGNEADKLPLKFVLADRYVVGKVIHLDHEGVTYMAWDNSSSTAVSVREYFPMAVAHRNPDKTVSPTADSSFAYNEGLMEFLERSDKLISAELPSMFTVFSVFEENGTAYAVGNVPSGITLADFLERNGGSLKWEQVRPLFLPLIDTVKALHEMGIIHGGISPESILVGRDGKLRLINLINSGIRSGKSDIPTELYGGYAAVEQYGYENLTVDAYTDVYGMSATLFRAIVGNTLPVAVERIKQDTMSIPARLADELPRQVLVALANGLQVNPKNRTATIETFKNELVYGETQENVRRAENRRKAEQTAKENEPQKQTSSAKYAVMSALITTVVFLVIAGILCLTVFREDIFGSGDEVSSTPESSTVAPSVPSIGDVDSDAAESKQLYSVPKLEGQYFSQIIEKKDAEEDGYERFKFVIKDKEYSDKFARGTICAQSIAPEQNVEKDTEIAVTISLGPKEIKIANVLDLEESAAKLELLKQGFLYENIEVVGKYDPDENPGVVLDQEPKYGETVNAEILVRIYVNSYTGDDDSSQTSSSR